MHKLTLLTLALILLIPTPGRAQSDTIPIAPCMYLYDKPVTMTLDAPYGFQTIWTEVEDEPATPFVELEATKRIVFLGYAPRGYGQLEWYGVKYGWKGVDLTKTYPGVLMFYNTDGKLVARAEIRQYLDWDAYLVWITALEKTTDANGEHLGYHKPKGAPKEGCNFVIEEHDFQQAMGWE